MSKSQRASLYFVASPLQYLAARRIAQTFEQTARQVLVWYQPGVAPIVKADDWDAASYMPWPRWNPLPGAFGRLRRMKENIGLVADLVGQCDELHIHSAVFDTEAINYFLRALPKRCGARVMRARILPDGLISIRRYPLSRMKMALQYLRKLRRLAVPELDYWCFTGDRIGSDAPFCDRIYVLPGLPHEYPNEKVVELPALIDAQSMLNGKTTEKRALVIGQPLEGAGLMSASDRDNVASEIHEWLKNHGVIHIDYKGHPKDPNGELCMPDYHVLDIEQPLEIYMAENVYDVVLGVRSSALLFAKQIYGTNADVTAFGWEKIIFKSKQEKIAIKKVFADIGVNVEQ